MKSNQNKPDASETPKRLSDDEWKVWAEQVGYDPSIPDPDDEVERFWAWLFLILLICAIIGLCIGKAACNL